MTDFMALIFLSAAARYFVGLDSYLSLRSFRRLLGWSKIDDRMMVA